MMTMMARLESSHSLVRKAFYIFGLSMALILITASHATSPISGDQKTCLDIIRVKQSFDPCNISLAAKTICLEYSNPLDLNQSQREYTIAALQVLPWKGIWDDSGKVRND